MKRLESFIGKRVFGRSPKPRSGTLTAQTYDDQYYKEHADAGLDYLMYDHWQKSYAAMVTEATLQSAYTGPFVVDAGCACGSILKGFRDTSTYERVLGVDLSEHMIELGRKRFGYTKSELCAGSITSLPADAGSVSLLHSAQVLEHIPDELTDAILDEFARVLRVGGRAFLCLDALRDGENKRDVYGRSDPCECPARTLLDPKTAEARPLLRHRSLQPFCTLPTRPHPAGSPVFLRSLSLLECMDADPFSLAPGREWIESDRCT